MTTLTQTSINTNTHPLVIGEFSIRQDENGRYCLNDLHKASGDLRKDRPSYFLENNKTIELIQALKDENYDVGNPSSCLNPINIIRGRGKEQGTYVVKELVYAYGMWISAKFHLTIIRAYDALVMQWQINERRTISPEQQAMLHEIVARRSNGERKVFAEMWARHNRHFKIPRYSELHAIHFSESVHYLETMELKSNVSSKTDVTVSKDYHESVQGLALHMLWANSWWKSFGEAIRILNPNISGAIHDHFVDGSIFAHTFITKENLEEFKRFNNHYAWYLNSSERMMLRHNR